MTRILHLVTGLGSALNSFSSRYVDSRDEHHVLLLFSEPAARRQVHEQLRRVAQDTHVHHLPEPSEYRRLLADPVAMTDLIGGRAPDEIRMFLSHSYWLLNATASAFPRAGVSLFEEGMAGFYPDNLANLDFLDRVARVEYHDYLGVFRPLAALSRPELFEQIDPAGFLAVVRKAAGRRAGGLVDRDTIVVAEQYFHRKGKSVSYEDTVDLYHRAAQTILERGYKVAYKPHPRHGDGVYDEIRARLPESLLPDLALIADREAPLEALLAHDTPAGVAAVNSTVMLTAPHVFGVPSYRIETDIPLRMSADLGIERLGQVTNFLALRDRIPALSDLPARGAAEDGWAVFSRTVDSVPSTINDPVLIRLADPDLKVGAGFPKLVDQLVTSTATHVSFDVFDTLVTRPVVHGSDVFALGDREFADRLPAALRYSNVRSAALGDLRAQDALHGQEQEEYTLAEVCEHAAKLAGVAPDATEGLAHDLAAYELDLDRRLLRPRRAVVALYLLAKRLGKQVGVVSDCFYSSRQLADLLQDVLPEPPDFVFASADHRATKRTGRLFDVVLSRLGIEAADLLHLGDNPVSDVEQATARGIAALGFKPTVRAAAETRTGGSLWRGFRQEKSIALIRGVVSNRFFDNPFSAYPKDATALGSPYSLGYVAVGPAVLGWTLWIAEQARRNGHDQVAFVSRDGAVPLWFYRRLRTLDPTLPRPSYLFSSRRIAFQVFGGTHGHVSFTDKVHGLNPGNTPRNLLTSRFGPDGLDLLAPRLAAAGIGSPDLPLGHENLRTFRAVVLDSAAELARLGAERASAAARYYDKELGEAHHPVVVDLGYSGSTQRSILLATGRRVDGLYFVTMEHAHEYEPILDVRSTPWSQDRTFFRYGTVLEYLVTPMDLPETLGIDPVTAAPMVAARSVTDRTNAEIQRGLHAFLTDVLDLFGTDVVKLAMRPDSATHWLSAFLHSPSATDARILAGGWQDDTVGSGATRLLDSWQAGADALAG